MERQEELFAVYARYIQFYLTYYQPDGIPGSLTDARMASFANALADKAQQLIYYASGTANIDIVVFSGQLYLMMDEAIEALNNN